MTANKIIFGITGPSGSGKSYVSDLFRKKGVTVFDGDIIAREIVMPGKPAANELREHFGDEYFDSKGELDRRRLASKVFADENERRILNKITHKHIRSEIEARLTEASGLCAVDGAVIIGSDIENMCRFFVGVLAPREIRIERLKKRDAITEKEISARLNSQPSDDFYRKHCRYIIENDGSCDVEAELKKILEDIGK